MIPPSTLVVVLKHLSRGFIIGGISGFVLNTSGLAVTGIYLMVVGVMMMAEDYIQRNKEQEGQ